MSASPSRPSHLSNVDDEGLSKTTGELKLSDANLSRVKKADSIHRASSLRKPLDRAGVTEEIIKGESVDEVFKKSMASFTQDFKSKSNNMLASHDSLKVNPKLNRISANYSGVTFTREAFIRLYSQGCNEPSEFKGWLDANLNDYNAFLVACYQLEDLFGTDYKELKDMSFKLGPLPFVPDDEHPEPPFMPSFMELLKSKPPHPLVELFERSGSEMAFSNLKGEWSDPQWLIEVPDWLAYQLLLLYAKFVFPREDTTELYPPFPKEIRRACAEGMAQLIPSEKGKKPLVHRMSFYYPIMYLMQYMYLTLFPRFLRSKGVGIPEDPRPPSPTHSDGSSVHLSQSSMASSLAPSVHPSVNAPSVHAPSVHAPSVNAPSVIAPSVAPSTASRHSALKPVLNLFKFGKGKKKKDQEEDSTDSVSERKKSFGDLDGGRKKSLGDVTSPAAGSPSAGSSSTGMPKVSLRLVVIPKGTQEVMIQVMNDTSAYLEFKDAVESMHCTENIVFYDTFSRLELRVRGQNLISKLFAKNEKALPEPLHLSVEWLPLMHLFYYMFIKPGSEFEMNLPSTLRKKVEAQFSDFAMLDECMMHVLELLYKNNFPSYLKWHNDALNGILL